MKKHISDTRTHLGELNSLANKTDKAERQILERASARLEEVNAQIKRAQPGLEGAPDASQDRYLELVQERGQLQMVIAKARSVLGL